MAKCRVCQDDGVVMCIDRPGLRVQVPATQRRLWADQMGMRHLVICPACTDFTPLKELLEDR